MLAKYEQISISCASDHLTSNDSRSSIFREETTAFLNIGLDCSLFLIRLNSDGNAAASFEIVSYVNSESFAKQDTGLFVREKLLIVPSFAGNIIGILLIVFVVPVYFFSVRSICSNVRLTFL